MDPGAGRFVSQDSYMGSSSDPISLHKYVYGNNGPTYGVDPSGNFTLIQVIQAVSTLSSLVTAAVAGYEFGSIGRRTYMGEAIFSMQNFKSLASIALAVVPMGKITKIRQLAGIAREFEVLGWAVKIYDADKKVTGFSKIFHFIQRLHERGISVKMAMEALQKGAVFVDRNTGAQAFAMGVGKDAINVIVQNGVIVTAYLGKLGSKFVRFVS